MVRMSALNNSKHGEEQRMRLSLGALLALVLVLSACTSSSLGPLLQPTPSPSPSPTFPPIPTPPPNPTPTPMNLPYGGQTIGAATFPNGDTATGGQGSPVDTLSCYASLSQAYHIHTHLTMLHNGTQIALPLGVGVISPVIVAGTYGPVVTTGSCFYPLHTHDASGIVHIENAAPTAFTLGQVFDIWGMSLTSSGFAGFSGPMLVYVGTSQFTGDPRTITLANHEQITLEVGGPFVFPPFYAWSY